MPARSPPVARHRGPLAALLVAALALPATTWAAPPIDPDRPGGPLQTDPAGDDAVRAAMLSELGLPEHPEVQRALALAGGRRHAEAAALLETLAGSLGDPRLLYHAALLRGLAGEHVRACGDFEAFLSARGSTLTPAVRDYVGALRAQELAQTAQVMVNLFEETGGPIAAVRLTGARITLHRVEDGAPRAPITVTAGVGTRIDAGRWEVIVEHPDYRSARALHAVEGGPDLVPWELRLQRRRVLQDLRFRPKRALRRGRLRLTSDDLQPPRTLEHAIDDEQVTLPLTTGAWTLEATAGRRYQATKTIVVRDPPAPIDVELTRRPAPSGPSLESSRKAPIALAVVVGVSYLTGVGLLLGGISRDTRADERNEAAFLEAGVDLSMDEPITPAALTAVESTYPTADYHRDLRVVSNLQTTGIVVAMAGASSAITIVPLVRKKRRAAFIELGVGAAFLAGGAAWMASFARMQADLLGGVDPQARASEAAFNRLTGHRLGAGMFTGIGLGTVLGPVIVLVRDRLRRR